MIFPVDRCASATEVAGSSRTVATVGYIAVILLGFISLIIAMTRCSRFKKTTSMENFIPKVWTPLQGFSQRPDPCGRESFPRSPFILVKTESATIKLLTNTCPELRITAFPIYHLPPLPLYWEGGQPAHFFPILA